MIKKFIVGKTYVYKGICEVAAWNCPIMLCRNDTSSLGCLKQGDILVVMNSVHTCALHHADHFCVDFLHPKYGLITLHGNGEEDTFGSWNRDLALLK